ncbi:acyl-CoA thioester hydrolase [Noviherbaspirillum humi]|uniref:Acyl-CoA thioester hydrolase n=1 Tax=Noviherbaspirillum humi TaxID=1688639 RepID=A0A239JUK9_9BURK|nr:acyl-CoA thioesterase [Noviherbaspirillum humi]SNT09475.1 acyl-CoA thioester hydrolase [Noviherbaspirillum humi]
MATTESVINTAPFTVRRRVKWGECDPAGVVYTAQFADYVISAAELFYEYLFSMPPQRAKDRFGFGTPTRALNIDFRSSLWPDDEFDMTVAVKEIRTRTYVLQVDAVKDGQTPVFSALLTVISIARGERRAIEIPDVLRHRLQAEIEKAQLEKA